MTEKTSLLGKGAVRYIHYNTDAQRILTVLHQAGVPLTAKELNEHIDMDAYHLAPILHKLYNYGAIHKNKSNSRAPQWTINYALVTRGVI